MRNTLYIATLTALVWSGMSVPCTAGDHWRAFCEKCRFSKLNPHTWHVSWDDHETEAIPSTRPVPRGWVVVGYRKSHLQIGGTCYETIIQKLSQIPGTEMIIAINQPIPPGWALIEEIHTIYLPGCGPNAYRIIKM